MASNKGRDYCCDQHADANYNVYRKTIKIKGAKENIPVSENLENQADQPVNKKLREEALKKTIEIFSVNAIILNSTQI